MARASKKKASSGRAARRSPAEIKSILDQVESLTNSGSTIKDALGKLGVSYSNFNYWSKHHGQGAGAGKRGGKRAGAGSVMGVLKQMTDNRAERSRLEKSIRDLDARFNVLKRKLERQ